MTKTTFKEEFVRRYDDIKARGEAVGMTVSDICKQAGVSRATPERWKKEIPLTIRLIDRMDEAVKAQEQSAQR